MYCEEMEHWLAEERLEEARSQVSTTIATSLFLCPYFVLNGAIWLQARLVAALLHQDREQEQCANDGAGDTSTGETVQVVEDEDEVTTIRRPILPDISA